MWLTRERGLHIQNLDTTIMLERPRLRPYVQAMRDKIAEVLEVDVGCVSIKAKTGEGLDAVGAGNAVTVHAIVLLTSAKVIE
jgi:2-C-methyl-D-erythritol 2,4-cyclodiphosphate synthase